MSADARTFVIYHRDNDGFGAAFCAWLALGDEGVEYVSIQYGEKFPEIPDGSRVYIVDFSWPDETPGAGRAGLTALAERCKLWVLDHHKTAAAELKGLDFVRFDMEKAGCELAWDFFAYAARAGELDAPDEMLFEPMPKLLRHVALRDLWKHVENPIQRKLAEAVHVALMAERWDFHRWRRHCAEEGWMRLLENGSAMLVLQEQVVDSLARKAFRMRIAEHPAVPVVNSSVWQSEICHRMLELNPDVPWVACCFDKSATETVFSLRSRGEVDVSGIAKRMGGGGHAAAAGFTVRSCPSAVQSVLFEREAQKAKWGEQAWTPMEWMAVLGEEFGESCQAAISLTFGDALDVLHLREELVQTAAVAVQIIEAIDTGRMPLPEPEPKKETLHVTTP